MIKFLFGIITAFYPNILFVPIFGLWVIIFMPYFALLGVWSLCWSLCWYVWADWQVAPVLVSPGGIFTDQRENFAETCSQLRSAGAEWV